MRHIHAVLNIYIYIYMLYMVDQSTNRDTHIRTVSKTIKILYFTHLNSSMVIYIYICTFITWSSSN